MGSQLLRYLPRDTRCLDLKDLGSVRRVRRALVGHLHQETRGQRGSIERAVFTVLPQAVYAQAARQRGRRARLLQLLGHAGAGQTGTLLIPAASVLSTATEVMAGASGPVAGVHLMYGPQVADLSRETAILCVPPAADRHHLLPAARAYLHGLLDRMGHGRVLELTPTAHDSLMANVQFLSHCLFLCLGAAVRAAQGGAAYHPGALPGWLDEAVQIVQRILNQESHVYGGIARDNPFNAPLAGAWLEGLSALGHAPLGDLVGALLELTRRISERARRETGVRVTVSTPVSRYREHLLALAPHWSGEPGPRVDAAALAWAYGEALRGPYGDWFERLAGWFPERAENRSQALIDALPALPLSAPLR